MIPEEMDNLIIEIYNDLIFSQDWLILNLGPFGYLLWIVHIHGVTITKIRPPWHVLLDYSQVTTREFIKNL